MTYILSTVHSHTTYCDGKNTPAEMAEAAYKLGFLSYGFSAHSHLPYKNGYAIKMEKEKLYREIFSTELYGIVERFGDRLVILPRELPVLDGLGVLRAGVAAGIWKKGRVEPEHGLFMAARSAELRRELALSSEEEAVAAFLRGEEVDCDENGYTGVTVDGVTLGFGKCSGGRLKNHYPKGLRNLR